MNVEDLAITEGNEFMHLILNSFYFLLIIHARILDLY